MGASVTVTGTQYHGNTAYVGIMPNTNQCLAAGIYFTNSNEIAKTLNIALTAKASGKTVRIDFDQPNGAGGQCIGYSIYLE